MEIREYTANEYTTLSNEAGDAYMHLEREVNAGKWMRDPKPDERPPPGDTWWPAKFDAAVCAILERTPSPEMWTAIRARADQFLVVAQASLQHST